jgi:hypothetical protein
MLLSAPRISFSTGNVTIIAENATINMTEPVKA